MLAIERAGDSPIHARERASRRIVAQHAAARRRRQRGPQNGGCFAAFILMKFDTHGTSPMRDAAGAFPCLREIFLMFAPVVAAATLLLALGSPSTWNLRISIMRDRLIAESPLIRTYGVNPFDFVFRLDYLEGRIASTASLPAQSPQRTDIEQEAALELKLDGELLVNLCPVFGAVDGVDESFYNDDPRAPPDPVAFYVPKPDSHGKYGLVIVLHGRRQTETDVLSRSELRSLADQTHAILVAPFGIGGVLWGDLATREIYAITAEMEKGFAIDGRHVYLAGVDVGGSGVFHIVAAHPEMFRAAMSLGGGLAENDLFTLSHSYRNGNIYLVGQNDTYDVLSHGCVPVSYYPVDGSNTDFYQTQQQISQAWSDMFDGIVRNTNTRECSTF
jgi:hypothetical protein